MATTRVDEHGRFRSDQITWCARGEDCTNTIDLVFDDHEVLPNREVACLPESDCKG